MNREHPHLDRLAHKLEHLEEAAIEAEFDTGTHEDTVAEAKAHVLIRLGRMGLGSIVLLAGLAMLALPGPGWIAIAAGLAILAKDVAWADRALRYVKRRVPGIPEDGKIPRSALLTSGVLAAAGIAASIWWYTR
ncbi:MAG: hypothetical protein OEY23_13020 [Acidimicrobiia bacterium]|nr:hypothetical protein [Acidimicrobiia bacterium]